MEEEEEEEWNGGGRPLQQGCLRDTHALIHPNS